MGKYLGRLSSLATVTQPVKEKENLEFKPAVFHFKIGIQGLILPLWRGWVDTYKEV